MVLTCIWKSDEFVLSESKTRPPDDEAYIIIDEPAEKVSVHIPSSFSIVQKRIIERRVQTISKSGFFIPKLSIRIGMGFDISITKDDAIPDILLQVGHHYSYDKPTSPYFESSVSDAPELDVSSDSEYKPSFLIHDPVPSTITPQPEAEAEPAPTPERKVTLTPIPTSQPETEPAIEVKDEQFLHDDESVAGRFIIALSKSGDVYLSRIKDHFLAEFSMGRVEFSVENNDITIHSTKRVPSSDPTLEQALEAARRKV